VCVSFISRNAHHNLSEEGLGSICNPNLNPIISLFFFSGKPLAAATKHKLALFCHVPPEHCLGVHDVSNIYRVPLLLNHQVQQRQTLFGLTRDRQYLNVHTRLVYNDNRQLSSATCRPNTVFSSTTRYETYLDPTTYTCICIYTYVHAYAHTYIIRDRQLLSNTCRSSHATSSTTRYQTYLEPTPDIYVCIYT